MILKKLLETSTSNTVKILEFIARTFEQHKYLCKTTDLRIGNSIQIMCLYRYIQAVLGYLCNAFREC